MLDEARRVPASFFGVDDVDSLFAALHAFDEERIDELALLARTAYERAGVKVLPKRSARKGHSNERITHWRNPSVED
jgi:hypothetical protein